MKPGTTKKIVRTAVILTTLLAPALTVQPAPVQASDAWMKPGGWANPYVIRPDGRGGAEIQPAYPDPANPASMKPGSYLNPMTVRPQSDGSYTIEPWLNLPDRPGEGGY